MTWGVVCVVIKKNRKMDKFRQCAHSKAQKEKEKERHIFYSFQVTAHLQYQKLASCIPHSHPVFSPSLPSSPTTSSKSGCGLQKSKKLYICVSIGHFSYLIIDAERSSIAFKASFEVVSEIYSSAFVSMPV